MLDTREIVEACSEQYGIVYNERDILASGQYGLLGEMVFAGSDYIGQVKPNGAFVPDRYRN